MELPLPVKNLSGAARMKQRERVRGKDVGGLGGQDKGCRIQISREALPSHPDLIGSSPEIRCVYYLCPAWVEVSAGRVLGQRGGEKAGLGRAPLLSANPFE